MGLRDQLKIIAGADEGPAYFELRAARSTGGMRQHFIPLSTPDLVVERVASLSPQADLYIGAAPRVERRGTADAVQRVWCLWADCDSLESVILVEQFKPRPSLLVRSGKGMHAWWALDRWVSPTEATDLNSRLASAILSDPKVTDPARILRPVGSVNHKYSSPRPVEEVHCYTYPYPPEVVAGWLPEVTTPATAPTAMVRTFDDDKEIDDLLKNIPAEEYLEVLTGRTINRSGFAQCPFHSNGEETKPSLKVYGNTWTCFGSCDPVEGAGRHHLGGGIYQLAALVWGVDLPLRGKAFSQVTKRLEELFLPPELRITLCHPGPIISPPPWRRYGKKCKRRRRN